MKKILFLFVLSLLAINFAKAQDKIYIMKGTEIMGEHVVSDIDSIIFYTPPPPDPIAVTGINLTANTANVFSGQTINLASYISSILPANATDKSVTWSSNNASAISITNASTGAAVAGTTGTSAVVTVKANDGSNVSASLTINVSAEQPNTYHKGNIPNAAYIGRWKTVSGYDVSAAYPGTMIKVNFTGKSAKLNYKVEWSLVPVIKFFAKIDNGPWKYYSATYGTDKFDLVTGYPSFDNTLPEHSLWIVSGQSNTNTDTTSPIACSTLELDPGAVTKAPKDLSTKHIDFIGDSISTILYEDTYPEEHWNWIIGENLGWEHSHYAWPSQTTATMSNGYSNFHYTGGGAWDFANEYKTHAIVVNLGQNDGGGNPSVATYKTAIQKIRSNWVGIQDNIPIICLGLFWNTSGQPRSQGSLNIEQAVNELRSAGDTHVYFLKDAEGKTASLHPQDAENDNIAAILTPKIQAILANYY